MTVYRIVLHASSRALATLLPLFTGEQAKAEGVTYFAANPLSDPEPLPPSPPPPPRAPIPTPEPTTRYANGMKNKGVRGDALVLDTLRSGPADMSELKRVFINRHFAASSAPQYVSKLLKAKQIERRAHGRYALMGNGRA